MKRVREQPRPRVSGGFRLCSAVVALLLAVVVPAEVPVPALAARVTDLTGTLAAGEAAALEQKLAAFEQRKGTQIAVLVVATTAPETIEQFGIRVAEAWRLGRKGVDDGVLLLIAKDDRTLRIEVGYGLEGVLPDATARRIIDEFIVPHFRAGDFAGGIDAGLERIMALIDGEPLPEPVRSRGRGGGLEGLGAALPVVFIFTLTFGTLLKRLMGQLPGALATGGACFRQPRSRRSRPRFMPVKARTRARSVLPSRPHSIFGRCGRAPVPGSEPSRCSRSSGSGTPDATTAS